jgi:hypothetical protein
MDSTNLAQPPRMTIDQLGDYLRSRGFPIKQSTLKEYCKPLVAKGPRPVERWGRRLLFDPQTALEWAQARLRPIGAEGAK